jgi:hypothetical protein
MAVISGGYAFVFIAQDLQSNQDYALKVTHIETLFYINGLDS